MAQCRNLNVAFRVQVVHLVNTFEWHYVGRFGQLGPLSEDQMFELIESQVVLPETYVWRSGMSDWVRADSIDSFRRLMAPAPPPPLPAPSRKISPPIGTVPQWTSLGVVSPHSRVTAGILQIIPGVGRMYLGYLAIGILQFCLTFCTAGLFILWSWIDGILILLGSVNVDGYGRLLRD